MYFIIALLVLVLILTIVHFTITPIFKSRGGGSGIISLPGTEDSQLLWPDVEKVSAVPESDTTLTKIHENWSFLIDFQVDNPTANIA